MDIIDELYALADRYKIEKNPELLPELRMKYDEVKKVFELQLEELRRTGEALSQVLEIIKG